MSKDNSDQEKRQTATDLVHTGRAPFDHHGFVNTPLYRGSTVLYPTLEMIRTRRQPYTYGRRATPTTDSLEQLVTKLEGGTATVLTSSGMNAIATALLAFCAAGDHILVTDSAYQPTRAFCDDVLKRIGVETEYYDPTLGTGIADLFRTNTKLILLESPGSLTFEMQDIPAIVTTAKEHNIWVIADNTWASPIYCQPIKLGCDVSIQAATKYIVGHADALLGTITSNERAARIVNRAKESLGTCPGSEETYLALRGIRTLEVRLERHWQTALQVADWLASRPEVEQVMHPARTDHPGHHIWKRDYTGASGLFSIVLKPVSENALAAFLDHLKYFGMGYSWGGYESLVIPFDPTNYRTATKWQAAGPALRFHIGLEGTEDLIADLEAGFARMASAASA